MCNLEIKTLNNEKLKTSESSIYCRLQTNHTQDVHEWSNNVFSIKKDKLFIVSSNK